MVCGALLEKEFGKDAVFNLTIPSVSTQAPSEWDKMAAIPGVSGLLVDEMPVLIRMELAS